MGSGIGYRRAIKDELIFDHTQIDFVEVIGEHFMGKAPYMKEELHDLLIEYTAIPHFIGLSLGSAEGIKESYIEKIASVLEVINPPYWSEHIAFTECHGLNIGHLTPLPYSQEALDVFTKNIEKVQSYIQTPLILENITYVLNDPIQEMTEAEFLRKLFDSNPEIGMLLDITNLFINSKNHGYDYKEWLNQIDCNRVVQIHYVGHDQRGSLLIDNHSYPTQEEIWEVMSYIQPLCPNLKGSVLERDNKFGPMEELRAETKRAKEILFS